MDVTQGVVMGETTTQNAQSTIFGTLLPLFGDEPRSVEVLLKVRCGEVGSIFKYGVNAVGELFDCGFFPDDSTVQVGGGFSSLTVESTKPAVSLFHHFVWTYESEIFGLQFFANGIMLASDSEIPPLATDAFGRMELGSSTGT